jgi:hypothetical protein
VNAAKLGAEQHELQSIVAKVGKSAPSVRKKYEATNGRAIAQ